MAPYYDAKSGREVTFSYAIDALEAVEAGYVVTEKGSKPAPAPKKEEAPAPEPIKEEPKAEPIEESTEEPAPAKKPAPRRRSSES